MSREWLKDFVWKAGFQKFYGWSLKDLTLNGDHFKGWNLVISLVTARVERAVRFSQIGEWRCIQDIGESSA